MNKLLVIIQSVGLIAIAGTGEIDLRILGSVVGFALTVKLIRKQFSDRIIFLLLFTVVASTIVLLLKLRLPSVVGATYATIFIHPVLWFSSDTKRINRWILALSFFEITLAGSLSPDFYLAAFILLYTFFTQKYLIEDSYKKTGIQNVPQQIKIFSTLLSSVTVITAIVLFPFLPRSQLSMDGGWGQFNIGYTDTVDLNRSVEIQKGPIKTALRVFISKEDLPLIGNYIRGRVLEHFSADEWYPNIKKRRVLLSDTFAANEHTSIRIIREPIGSPTLPVPYGSEYVELEHSSDIYPLNRTISNEWILTNSEKRRIQYQSFVRYGSPDDQPTPVQLKIPAGSVSDRFKKWAESVIPQKAPPHQQLRAIQEYFRKENFTVSLDSIEPFQQLSRLDRFIFIEKSGNCELFATATALALRHVGVPTRLISGFKINRPPVGEFLNILTQDAHAWVEVWNEQSKTWITSDPTPAQASLYSWVDEWIDRVEYVKSFWYQYIITYESKNIVEVIQKKQSNSKKQTSPDEKPTNNEWIDYWLIPAFLIISLLFGLTILVRSFPGLKKRLRESNYERRIRLLNQELDRFNSLDHRKLPSQYKDTWKSHYLESRFGKKPSGLLQTIAELRVLRLGIKRISKSLADEVQQGQSDK